VSFGGRAIQAIRRCGSALALGIDPRDGDIPPAVWAEAKAAQGDAEATAAVRAEAIRLFSNALVDLAIEERLAAVKPQAAFYEAAGPDGVRAFAEAIVRCRGGGGAEGGPLVIADVKRGDIGSTAEAYAEAYLGAQAPFPADAATVNAFLGADSLAPWLARAKADDRSGIFVLVRTSNPGAADIQERRVSTADATDENVSDVVAALVERLSAETRDGSGYGAVGAVVGATAQGAAARLRKAMPSAILLAPGVGAQGATAKDLAPFFDAKGEGALVPVSRAISGAWREPGAPTDWRAACRAAIRRLKAEVRAAQDAAAR